ncbi:cellulase family glycosylhydrolase [Azospirillum doebereinerae]|uniref:cellulase n=1 Tax=Azospirillum doebereinerae TaxID=92933 RepID=A0A433J3G5_9PROT|nr:carbohydrate-binding domain-containing protein [Azospirillum doebereinerae]RUQ66326.1 endoglucanase [Azospirillum doebereinerae]
MATTTNARSIVVNAYGQSGDSIAAHFRLLVDGKEVGQATTTSASKAYSFTADLASDVAHTIKVAYDNDAVNSSYRDLYVQSVVVDGKTMLPTQAVYERYDTGATTTTQAGQSGMWWDGALSFTTQPTTASGTTAGTTGSGTTTGSTGGTTSGSGTSASTTSASTIVVNAQGTAAGGVNAHFKVLVDGTAIGEGTATTSAHDYSFTTSLTADQAHKVQIQYDNDAYINGQDRNLTVNSIKVNGHSYSATDSAVTYDKGALDGKDVIAGQKGLWWNGTLVVDADKSHFTATTDTSSGTSGSGTTTGGTGTGTVTTPALSVSDATVKEPTASTTSTTTIADGYLHTEGSQIVDSAGNNVKLTGVNWFGAEGYAFAPQGLWEDSYQNMMDQMKSLGFNTIRLPWSDAMLDNGGQTPTGIDYNLNPDLKGLNALQIFDKIVDYADQTGMKIILDHHRSDDGASANENGLWYTSAHPESMMIANSTMLAERYSDNPSVIGMDLHNEPHGQATWGDGNLATDWAAAAERIGNAIQKVNPNLLLIVEGVENYGGSTYWWGGNLDGTKTSPVEFNVDNQLVYSVHDYPPSMAGFGWFSDSSFPNNMSSVWTDAWGYLVQNDVAPVLVGEFGTKLATTQDTQWLNAITDYMNGDWNGDGKSDLAAGDQGVSWTYWAWSPGSGDTGGILNDDYTVNTAKVNIIKEAMYSGSTSGTATADAVFTVKLASASTETVTVKYATADGTAKAGSDYTAASGTLTFAPGETAKTVTVKVLSDSAAEGAETFSLNLSGATKATLADATGLGTITDASSTTASTASAASATAASLVTTTAATTADAATTDVWAHTVTTAATDATDTTAAHSLSTADILSGLTTDAATTAAAEVLHANDWYIHQHVA